ncbi:hypothetical protein ACYOEI_22270 [Singulisphaera rosea]
MRSYQRFLFPTGLGLICLFWFSTLSIIRHAPLLSGPRDEAERALAFFVRDTVISLGLMVALFVFRRRIQPWVAGKPREGRTLLD